jgi:hypothetical protein
MSTSYRRRCRYCGRWIQMRKMPQGQYVAFDGYAQIHNCRTKTRKANAESANSTVSRTARSEPKPSTAVHGHGTSSAPDKTHGAMTDNSASVPTWVWWVGVLALIFLWLILRK